MSAVSYPERHPVTEARKGLARRLSLFYDDSMQDWEWEVADVARLQEFLNLYESGTLSDDERFSLMEIILQSMEESAGALDENPLWARTLVLLKRNLPLHFSSVKYWSLLETPEFEQWRVSPALRLLLA